MAWALALVLFATSVTVDVSTAAVVTIAAAAIAAYPSARLVAANRRKVITEAGAVADRRVLEFAQMLQADNASLRETVGELRGRLEANEHRCDVLERVLIEHGIPVPD